MDAKELEIIERRLGGCTPAPWITGSIPWQVWCDGGHGKICRVESCASDREFIAHARQDVPALLDEVRKLNLQNQELRKTLGSAIQYVEHSKIGHLVDDVSMETLFDATCFKCKALRVYFGPEEGETLKLVDETPKAKPENDEDDWEMTNLKGYP